VLPTLLTFAPELLLAAEPAQFALQSQLLLCATVLILNTDLDVSMLTVVPPATVHNAKPLTLLVDGVVTLPTLTEELVSNKTLEAEVVLPNLLPLESALVLVDAKMEELATVDLAAVFHLMPDLTANT